jgi:hypothetical protein
MADERIESALKEAHAACRHAQDMRGFYARRSERTAKQRQDDLHAARERVRLAMTPLRSFLGGAARRVGSRNNVELEDRVRSASAALQSERRKLWKMQTPEGRQLSKRDESKKKKRKEPNE